MVQIIKLFARTKLCKFQKNLQKIVLSQVSINKVIMIVTINYFLMNLVLHLLVKINP